MTSTEVLETGQFRASTEEIPQFQSAWISDSESFQQLRSDWNDLFDRVRCDNPFLSFDWMFTWWKHWNLDRRLAIITVRDARGCLIALAPFYISRLLPIGCGPRRLGFLADTHVGSDYLTVLAETEYEKPIEEIVRTLQANRQKWDYIELSDSDDSALLSLFCKCFEQAGFSSSRKSAAICFHITLPATFEKYLTTLSTSLRCNFRRRWRILQNEKQVELLALTESAEIRRHFPDLLRLHRMRFDDSKRESALFQRGVPEFQAEAAQMFASHGWGRLFLLAVNGGEIIAALYGFSLDKAFRFYQCGMHPGWRSSGIGQMLIGASIREVIDTGHTDFDFLRGGESYKSGWAKEARQTVTLRLFDRRPMSLLALSYFRMRTAASRIKARIANNASSRTKSPT